MIIIIINNKKVS